MTINILPQQYLAAANYLIQYIPVAELEPECANIKKALIDGSINFNYAMSYLLNTGAKQEIERFIVNNENINREMMQIK